MIVPSITYASSAKESNFLLSFFGFFLAFSFPFSFSLALSLPLAIGPSFSIPIFVARSFSESESGWEIALRLMEVFVVDLPEEKERPLDLDDDDLTSFFGLSAGVSELLP